MEKCLITTLRGEVQVDLPIFDAVRLYIKWGENESFAIKPSGGAGSINFGGPGTVIKVLQNGSIKVGSTNVGTEHTISATDTSAIDIIPTDGTVDTVIALYGIHTITAWGRASSSPYRMAHTDDAAMLEGSSISAATVALLAGSKEPADLSSIEKLPNRSSISSLLYAIEPNAYKGNIQSFASLPALVNAASRFSEGNPGVYGDIGVFEGNTVIQQISLRRNDRIVGMVDRLAGCSALTEIDLQSTGVTGNVESLGSCTQLTKIILSSASVTGTVEGLVAAFVAAGKTSGTISIGFPRTGITYNGESVVGTTLTWDGTDITIS